MPSSQALPPQPSTLCTQLYTFGSSEVSMLQHMPAMQGCQHIVKYDIQRDVIERIIKHSWLSLALRLIICTITSLYVILQQSYEPLLDRRQICHRIAVHKLADFIETHHR